MKPFIGKMPANNAPLGNGKTMLLFQQYRTGKTIDRIHYILYPDYSKKSSLLGEAGIDTCVRNSKYSIVNYDFDQTDGHISIDSARYVDGLGAYDSASQSVRSTKMLSIAHCFSHVG
jgi:hypothetical protein